MYTHLTNWSHLIIFSKLSVNDGKKNFLPLLVAKILFVGLSESYRMTHAKQLTNQNESRLWLKVGEWKECGWVGGAGWEGVEDELANKQKVHLENVQETGVIYVTNIINIKSLHTKHMQRTLYCSLSLPH